MPRLYSNNSTLSLAVAYNKPVYVLDGVPYIVVSNNTITDAIRLKFDGQGNGSNVLVFSNTMYESTVGAASNLAYNLTSTVGQTEIDLTSKIKDTSKFANQVFANSDVIRFWSPDKYPTGQYTILFGASDEGTSGAGNTITVSPALNVTNDQSVANVSINKRIEIGIHSTGDLITRPAGVTINSVAEVNDTTLTIDAGNRGVGVGLVDDASWTATIFTDGNVFTTNTIS